MLHGEELLRLNRFAWVTCATELMVVVEIGGGNGVRQWQRWDVWYGGRVERVLCRGQGCATIVEVTMLMVRTRR